MKKIFSIGIGIAAFLICIIGVTNNAYASECMPLYEDFLENCPEYDEIVELEPIILSELKNVGCTDIEEIDFSTAIKVYTNTDIFALNTDNRDTILDALQNGDYVWVLFLTSNGTNYKITLSVGQPLSENAEAILTDDEKQLIINNEGKWKVSAISEDVGDDYRTQIADNNEISSYGTDYVIVGGLSGLQMPIVLLFDSDKAVGFVELGFSYTILSDDYVEDISASSVAGSSVYDYNVISEIAKEYAATMNSTGIGSAQITGAGDSNDGETGQPSAIHQIIIAIAGIILILVVSLLIYRVKKGTSSVNE